MKFDNLAANDGSFVAVNVLLNEIGTKNRCNEERDKKREKREFL